jgi:hypothetical protein
VVHSDERTAFPAAPQVWRVAAVAGPPPREVSNAAAIALAV